MDKRNVGGTDVRVSEIALGTWGLATGAYGMVAPQVFERTIARALEAGVTTFDCAPAWGADGASERVIGKAIAGRREDVTLITRGGADLHEGKMRKRFDPDSLVRDCEASLERFGIEAIDLWLLHNPDELTLRREDWREAVQKLVAQGKVRAWGASVSDAATARLAIGAGAQVISIVYNLLVGDDLHDLAGDVSTSGCGVLALSPLSYGLLAGRWGESHRFGPGDHRSRRWTPGALRQRVRQAEMLRFLVHGEVRTLTAAAIRYVLSNAVVSAAVVGARTPGQITDAAEAAKGPPYLPDDDLMRIPQVLAAAGV